MDRIPWTTAEREMLRRHAALGAVQLSEMLGRSQRSVENMARRMRLSLRRPGERRGAVLGVPPDPPPDAQPHLAALRASVLAGTVDASRIQAIVADTTSSLCPSCARFPADHASGFCRVCYTARLRDAYVYEAAVRQAERDLWRERQTASRARRAETRRPEGADPTWFGEVATPGPTTIQIKMP